MKKIPMLLLAFSVLLSSCNTDGPIITEDDAVEPAQELPESQVFEDTENGFSIVLPVNWQKSSSEPTESEEEGVLKAHQWTAAGVYSGAKLYGEPLEFNFTLSLADEATFDMNLLEETPRYLLEKKDGNVYYYTYTRDVSCEQLDSNPNSVDEETVAACELLEDFAQEVKETADSFKLLN